MTVSIEQLQAFAAAADHGSFSAAARALGKAQSAISTQVANLETDLCMTLFSRDGRQPVLTPAGERLLRESRVVLDRREHLISVARSFEAGIEQRLVLAIDELFPEAELAAILARFAERFANVEVELLFPLMEDVSQLVLSGQADIGVMWRQEWLPPEIGFHTIGWAPIHVVCNHTHPLAQTDEVAWEDLKRHRQLLITTRHDSTEKQRLRIASEVWWVESHWVILRLVKAGVGWALVSRDIIEHSPVSDALVTPTLQFGQDDWPVAVEMIWHKHRPCGPAAAWLREALAATELKA